MCVRAGHGDALSFVQLCRLQAAGVHGLADAQELHELARRPGSGRI